MVLALVKAASAEWPTAQFDYWPDWGAPMARRIGRATRSLTSRAH